MHPDVASGKNLSVSGFAERVQEIDFHLKSGKSATAGVLRSRFANGA